MLGAKDLISLAVGPTCSLALVIFIFFHRNRVYVAWAKVASLLALVAGFGFAALGFRLLDWQSYHLDRASYYTFVGLRGLLGGIAVGFIFSILIARPYRKRSVQADLV